MEVIINKQTQQNYGEAMNAFFEIGKLVESENLDLSVKERKMFYDCYHFRRLQLLKDLVDSNNYLNDDIVKKLTDLFRLTEVSNCCYLFVNHVFFSCIYCSIVALNRNFFMVFMLKNTRKMIKQFC